MNILTAENVVPGLNVGVYNTRIQSSRVVLGVITQVLKTKIVVAIDDSDRIVEFDARGYEKKHAHALSRSVLVSAADAVEAARKYTIERERICARRQLKSDIQSMVSRFTTGAGEFAVDAALVEELKIMSERAEKIANEPQ